MSLAQPINHDAYADSNQRQTEPLPHVECHAALKRRLHLFQKFDAETKRTYRRTYNAERHTIGYVFQLVVRQPHTAE